MSATRMRRIALAIACFTAAAALVAWSASTRPPSSRPASVSERLLGPIANVAASLQWTRVDDAVRLGRPDLACARAEIALDLAPGDTDGWKYLAHHFAFDRGSLREPDRATRTRWVQAAFDLLERGEHSAREPGKLAFQRGVIFLALAWMSDDERSWPGTSRAAWLEAARAFDRAALAGEPAALEAATAARVEADRP